MEHLKPSETMDAIKSAFLARRSPMLHGDPGIGKTQNVWTVAADMFAEKYGWSFENNILRNEKGKTVHFGYPILPWYREFRTAVMSPEDFGLPRFDSESNSLSWAMSDLLPRDERGGVVFLDEVNRGTESMVNACFALVDRKVHGYVLPYAWLPIAAVNDKDIGARKLPSAFNARFAPHFDCKTDLDDVCRIASVREWHPAVIAFLRFRPDLLHAYEPKQRVSPNPRAWEHVSDLISQNPSPRIELALVAGEVGDGASGEFVGFLRLFRELPTIESILANPKKADVPTKPATLYAVAAALARRATTKNFDKVLTYFDRLSVEYNVFGVKTAIQRDVQLTKGCKAFTDWCIAHHDIAM